MHLLTLREPASACSHGAWLLMALPLGLVLWRKGRGDRGKQASLMVFAASLAACASASTAYHAVLLPDERIAAFRLVDHVGIVVLIAGTYTPIAWNLLRGRWRLGTLAMAWAVATTVASLQLASGGLPGWLNTALYLAMGWGAVFCFVELTRSLPRRDLRPIVAGGVFYSVGATINLAGWPVLWPGAFGAHDLFHVLVVAGSLAHFRFMHRVVAPAAREPLAAPAVAGRLRRVVRHAACVPGPILARRGGGPVRPPQAS